MNYKGIYDRIILRARFRELSGYSENHHVVPRCMGGSNKPANIVELTPEEHFTCHLLLVKIHPTEPKLVYAAKRMTDGNKLQSRKNKMYGWLRRRFSELQKQFRHTDESKEKIRIGGLGNTNGAGNLGLKRADTSKMSAARLGKKLTPESIAKREATKTANGTHKGGRPVGYTVKQETKDKIAATILGTKKDIQDRLSMSNKAKERCEFSCLKCKKVFKHARHYSACR